ncbi:formate dehydrogenase accessory protein FdhE [Brackiella oedipodis]|uniref:formate dehydrogenase accessory protein FdhE n=1 Tax=Brackiella oedipodis TaxID=124225 RepID=UPI00048D4F60|nr:formate dehydrogenase accessory protein FdhE [Brackiella oedipodis]
MKHRELKTPEQIQHQEFFHITRWIAPKPDVFAKRAERLHTLAQQDHSDWSHYLLLIAQIAKVQDKLLATLKPSDLIAKAQQLRQHPETEAVVLDAEFLQTQSKVIAKLFKKFYKAIKADLPQASQQTWQTLLALNPEALITLCVAHLQGQPLPHPAQAIWLHAVLEIVLSKQAMQFNEYHFALNAAATTCPCCGSETVASYVINHGQDEGLRYLYCGTCNSAKHYLRAQCTFCGSGKSMYLASIDEAPEGGLEAAVGECCDECHHYRKLFDLKKQQFAEVIADDLASLALDIKLGEAGYSRGGHNPYLMFAADTNAST